MFKVIQYGEKKRRKLGKMRRKNTIKIRKTREMKKLSSDVTKRINN